MVNAENTRQAFSRRLKSACDKADIRVRGRAVDIQKKLADSGIQLSTTAIGKWLNGESIPSHQNVMFLAGWLDVNPAWLEYGEGEMAEAVAMDSPHSSEYAQIPLFCVKGACGDGYLADHVELKDSLAFRRAWLHKKGLKPENLHAVYATGDSMEPFIFEGDVVLFDTSDIEPRHKRVYVIRRPDGSVSIKRLMQLMTGKWLIKSDNDEHETEEVSAATMASIPLIGRVIWRGGDMD